MKTIIAKQIAPEYQESPLDYIPEDMWPETIAVFGNRHYKAHIPPHVDRVFTELDELSSDLDDIEIDPDFAAFTTRPEAIRYHLGEDLTPEQVEAIDAAIIYKYTGTSSSETITAAAILSALTGHTWDYGTIRGTCQGDWQNVLFDMDEISPETLEKFEAEYWNTGEEWHIENLETGESWTMYVYSWRDDDKRQEIADAAGVESEIVKMYAFTGWTRTAKYEEVC